MNDIATRPLIPTRVLLVEDSPGDAALIERALRQAKGGPYELHHVESLSELLAFLASHTVAVALVDLSLPDSDGLETLRQTQAASPKLPIVVLTGLDDSEAAERAVRCGAQDYLVKGKAAPETIDRSIRYAIERKNAETLRYRLMHADRLAAIGQLSAGIAHEINNPATFILTNMTLMRQHFDVLRKALSDVKQIVNDERQDKPRAAIDKVLEARDLEFLLEETDEMLSDNFDGMDRIKSVLGDLGSFSRIECNSIELVDVREIVEVACKMTFNEVRHRAQLVKDFHAVPKVIGDRARLTQVVTNLVLNAAHAISEGAADVNKIRISIRHQDSQIIISFEDTGAGILSSELTNIFDPFFTTKPRGLGTGLGLSLSLETVRKHGGDITVSSEHGSGSRFDVILPEQTGLKLTALRPVAVRADPRRRLRVLLIDDDPLICSAYTRALSQHELVTAIGGKQALDLLDNDMEFDAVLCDLMMPELGGEQVYQFALHQSTTLAQRFVFISGGAFTPRGKDFLSSIPTPFFKKPVSPQLLLDAIERVSVQDPNSASKEQARLA